MPDHPTLVGQLAALARVRDPQMHGNGVATTLKQIGLSLPPRANTEIHVIDDPAPVGLTRHLASYPTYRTLRRWVCHEALPYWLTPGGNIGYEPALTVARLPGGMVLRYGNEPVVLLADGRTALSAYSGRYTRLLHYEAVDVAAALREARVVEGTAFLLGDDIHPANYSHWLLDTLPRLAALGVAGQDREVTLVVPTLTAGYQHETLHALGWDAARIVELAPMQAVRARDLLVTDDQPEPPHPMFKGAAWAARYLRRGLSAATGARADPEHGRRLYVSRGDALVRRVLNEPDLMAMLTARGFERVTMTGKAVRQQAAMFAEAAWIVAPHGAGLANLVFAPQGATVLELFAPTYGTPAFYVVAAAGGLRYGCHVVPEKDVVRHPSGNTQFDDLSVSSDTLATKYADFLPPA